MATTSMISSTLGRRQNYPPVKLPHPFLTEYLVIHVDGLSPERLTLKFHGTPAGGQPLPEPLHSDSLSWIDLTVSPKDECPPGSDNSPWARARRSPSSTFTWTGSDAPSLAQIWNVIHAIYLAHPVHEYFRLLLDGAEDRILRDELIATGLATEHPHRQKILVREQDTDSDVRPASEAGELLVLRSAFWQGAASPLGPRPIWVIGTSDAAASSSRRPLSQYPLVPETFRMTTRLSSPGDEEGAPVHARHPVRPAKPRPGTLAYSRYVPELDAHFSLEAVDWASDSDVALFSGWQNDPRVAAGWNETGTLEQHRDYLRRLHGDPHVVAFFGRLDEARFAYFEIYWAREDHYGAHYEASGPGSPYHDRGRHSLVGDGSLRGARRVNAWYSSCIHYCFLDEPRTANVVGEPRATGSSILSYENAQGLVIEKYVDLGHKRSAHSVCGREKWFQLCPLFWDGRDRPLESSDRAAWNAAKAARL